MGRTYISAHFMPDSRDLPVGADALVGPHLPPSQRQREAQQNTGAAPAERGGKCIRALPGPMVSPRARVLSNPKLGTASHPPPAAWRYALARTDPPWRFFLLDRPRPVLFLSRTKREWGVESSGDHRIPRTAKRCIAQPEFWLTPLPPLVFSPPSWYRGTHGNL